MCHGWEPPGQYLFSSGAAPAVGWMSQHGQIHRLWLSTAHQLTTIQLREYFSLFLQTVVRSGWALGGEPVWRESRFCADIMLVPRHLCLGTSTGASGVVALKTWPWQRLGMGCACSACRVAARAQLLYQRPWKLHPS